MLFKGKIDSENIPTKESLLRIFSNRSRIKDNDSARKKLEAKTLNFIKKAKKVWTGNEFNYSHTVFHSRGIIVIHKDFGPAWQRPEAHLKKVFHTAIELSLIRLRERL